MAKTVTFDVIARSTSSGFDKTNRDIDAQRTALGKLAPAVKRVQDAQGAAYLAQLRLNELRAKGTASASQMAAAEEGVARTQRNLTAAQQQLKDAQDKLNESGDKSNKSLKLLSTTAVALGPALLPIAAGAAAAGVGLAALGVTGVLAFEGIKKEMADGTSTGKLYTDGVNTLKGNLDTLERTAAGGVLTGFQNSVSAIQPLMPTLNSDTAKLSAKLGDIASHVMPGLVNLFTDANPLLLDFADYLDKGAAKFEAWTKSSDGATKFVDYARAELPKVEDTLQSLATTAGHLVQGIAPLGGTSLSAITLFSKAINTIPIGVLQALAPAILALKVANTVSAGLGNLTNSLTGFAGEAGSASRAATAFGEALPLISAATPAVILGLETISNQWSKIGPIVKGATLDATDNSKANNALADSFWAVNPGAKATNDALLKYGLSAQGAKDITQNYGVTTQQLNALLTQMGATQTQLNASTLSSTTYTTGLTGAQASLYAQVESSTTQIGYLNTALDKLSNFALDAEQQELKLKDSFASATQQLKGNGSALNDNTVKGRANKEWLLDEIGAINNHVSAVGKQTGSVKQATSALASDEQGLRNAAKAAGLNTQQVDALIKKYALTPKKLSTVMKLDTQAALSKIAGVQAALNDLHLYQTLHITEVTNKVNAGSAGTNLAVRDSGGPAAKGTPYLIGLNRRPEVFVPDSSGHIYPISNSARGPAAAGGGNTYVINLNGAIIGNTNQAIREIKRGLEQISNGGEPMNIKIASR